MPVSWFLKLRIAAFFIIPAAAMAAYDVRNATAQEGPTRGCLLAPVMLPEEQIKAFIERPSDLLDRHPSGGLVMSAEVKRLAATDVATLDALLELAKGASPTHVVAIGAGLAQAAHACSKYRPDTQRLIEDRVSSAGLADLAAAFAVYKLASDTSQAIPFAEVTPPPSTIGDSAAAVGETVVPPAPVAGTEPPATTSQPPSAAPIGQVPATGGGPTTGMGPFATSESALPFFAGQGGVGGGTTPPDGIMPLLQLGDFTFSPVALPFFAAGTSETSRDVVSPAR